jgi:oligopeptidase A
MQYANRRELRESLYRAYVTRASENALAPADPVAREALDNTAIIDELMALRQEEASLLGYASFAEVSLVPKMADTPAQVMQFLRDLARRARPFAQRDLAELRAFAAQELGLDDCSPGIPPTRPTPRRSAAFSIRRSSSTPAAARVLRHCSPRSSTCSA